MSTRLLQIVECLITSLGDSCQAARRGSACCISIILSGLGDCCLDALGADCITSLYKALKKRASREVDDVTLHYCATAIDTLGRLVKDVIFMADGRKLEKRIFVLDAPS